MATILIIETATPICSVAIEKDGKILSECTSSEANSHSSKLSTLIEELMRNTQTEYNQLDAVCVSSGPGSYTGLRIGVSTAKGLCYALDIPLLAINTLQNIALGYLMQHHDTNSLICPMIDARRMEVYAAIFDKDGNTVRPTTADIVTETTYDQWLNENPICFIGDGAAKTKPILEPKENVSFDTTFQISAKGMTVLAEKKFNNKEFENLAYFEPFYLKDFVAHKPNVKGLNI